MNRLSLKAIFEQAMKKSSPKPVCWEVVTKSQVSIWPVYDRSEHVMQDERHHRFFDNKEDAIAYAESALNVRLESAKREVERVKYNCNRQRKRWQEMFDRVDEIAKGQRPSTTARVCSVRKTDAPRR